MKEIKLYFSIFILLYSLTPFAQAKRVYTTTSIEGLKEPVIDGKLNENVWDKVAWGTDFIENQPDENTSPTYQTKFKVLYTNKFLYIGVFAFDNKTDKIEKRVTRRDGFAGDRINIVIDSYNDKRTAFIFTVTAAGVKGDEIATNNGANIDDSWNPVWYIKTSTNDKGWIAEIKIPLSQLRFSENKEQTWGFNVVRYLFRKDERSVWNRVPVDAPGFISEAGELCGLKNVKPQKQLEIQPYTALQYSTYLKEPGNPYRDGNDFGVNGGVDAKIGITNDLTLDLTINPDFGQVEADPGAFVLDGLQIFFEDRRPFFVENKNIFDYRFTRGRSNLFYSRRIGAIPHGRVNLDEGEYANIPQNTSILGAAKFSGKTQKGWSFGVLETLTSKEFAEIDNNGNKSKQIVEPLTNYLVLRTQKDFNDTNSFIGGIFTATNRSLGNDFETLHNSAYSAGIDFRHTWNNRNYFLESNIIVSKVLGSKESIEKTQQSIVRLFQREDAINLSVNPNRTSLTGTGGRVSIGKSGGGNWRYQGSVEWLSPELELNDIGFLRQTNQINQFGSVQYRILKPTKRFRFASITLEQDTQFDFDYKFNNADVKLVGNLVWKNNWWNRIGIGGKPQIYSNSFLRGGPRWKTTPRKYFFLFYGSNRQKKFNFNIGYIRAFIKDNSYQFRSYRFGFNYQPYSSLNFSFETSLRENPTKFQYITQRSYNNEKRYILGEIDLLTLNTSLRINYSINPDLSIQFYGSPFVSRGIYKSFNYATNSTAKKFTDRANWYTDTQITEDENQFLVDENLDGITDYSFRNPNFSFVQFQSNLVIRWEYIPGSEVFLVWSRGATGFADINSPLTTVATNQIFNNDATDTFLIKATYRFLL